MSSSSAPFTFHLCPATPAHVPSWHALQCRIYAEGSWFIGDGPPSSLALTHRVRSQCNKETLYLMAVSAPPHVPPQAAPTAEAGVLGWLELQRFRPTMLNHVAALTLAIDQRWRRRGIGKSLLAFGYTWARKHGIQKIRLEVRSSNRAAIALYKQQGFVVEGTERNHLHTPEGWEDNIIMARFLD